MDTEQAATGPQKTKSWKRGSTFNAAKRARHFPHDFITKGLGTGLGLGSSCGVHHARPMLCVLSREEAWKNSLGKTLRQPKASQIECGEAKKQPGLSAPVESPPQHGEGTLRLRRLMCSVVRMLHIFGSSVEDVA